MKKITLQIAGMTCAVCQSNIEEALRRLEGIDTVVVSLLRKEAIIGYEETLVTTELIHEAIEKSGYGIKSEQVVSKEQTQKHKDDSCTNPESRGSVIWFYIKSFAIILSLAFLYDNVIGFDKLILVKQDMTIGMVFVVGLISSVHCVSMCGGIGLSFAMGMDKENMSWKQKMMPSLQYQLGRLISYTALGAIVGGLGSILSISARGKSLITLIAGICMIAMALKMMGVADTFTNMIFSLLPRLSKKTDIWLRKTKRGKAPFVIGVLNGFMPCGPLQAMQVYALQTGSIIYGGISMFLFSLGTIPLMLVFSAFGMIRSKTFTHSIYRFGALVVLLLGLMMTNRSLLLQGIDVIGKMEGILNLTKTSQVHAKPGDDGQIIQMKLLSGEYQSISAQAHTPAKWIIEVNVEDLNGCNNEIVIPELGIRVELHEGINVIDLPPLPAGEYSYTCWMGMITGQITILM